ncbi:MAG: divalent-cation tolerance protein CutA [Thermoanaerobaculia bacterium]
MEAEYCVVITTCATKDDATVLSDALLNDELAACIQVMPIESAYRWKGEIAREPEQLLLVKTRRALYDDVERVLRAHHKYEVPEIIQLPIEGGFVGYLQWMKDVTK